MGLARAMNGLSWLRGRIYCRLHGVSAGEGLRTYGLPVILRHREARISLGSGVVLNSDPRLGTGICRRVVLAAPFSGSQIVIGNDSGLSGAVVYAAGSVTIGNSVNIGANTMIYDTDFHPVDWFARRVHAKEEIAAGAVVIDDDAWIGASSIILKNVHIGKRAVIGAGSVVTCAIPDGTLWAGNPARFIKNIGQWREAEEGMHA